MQINELNIHFNKYKFLLSAVIMPFISCTEKHSTSIIDTATPPGVREIVQISLATIYEITVRTITNTEAKIRPIKSREIIFFTVLFFYFTGEISVTRNGYVPCQV